jgi:DNA-binding SARP family transcriptional activator
LLQQAILFAREAVAIADANQSMRLRLQAYVRLGAILAKQGEVNLATTALDTAETVIGQFQNNAVGELYLWKIMTQWAKPTPDIGSLNTWVSRVRQLTKHRRQTHFIKAEGQQVWDTWQTISSATDIETALGERKSVGTGNEPDGSTREAAQTQTQITLVQHDLRVFGFGPGCVLRGDTPVATSQWGWSIPRDLFFYILTMRKATRAQIGLVFWPDHSTASMQSAFHNAKFAIKTALGKAVMVYVNGAYSITPDLNYLYDVNSFEHLIANSKQVSREDSLDDLINATALYTDDFLVGADSIWATRIRDELSRKYTQCCVDAAELAFAINQPDAVISILERAVQHDLLNEQIARMLMKSQWQAGKRYDTLKTYARLKTCLFDELGITPEIETERLISAIKNSK